MPDQPTLLPASEQLDPVDVQIESTWKAALESEFRQPYFHELIAGLKADIAGGNTVYPAGSNIFAAFAKTPLPEVKVVILGQDPYHNPGEAMGLSFSVPRGVRRPPSLLNVYKELNTDLEIPIAKHGDLTAWAEQGVLLLNSILTVRKNAPKSHHRLGWERFTDAVISTISREREHVVFLLWGKSAQSKAELVDQSRHLILEAAHPSPLARGAFFGSQPFSQANAYLEQHGTTPIDWQLPD